MDAVPPAQPIKSHEQFHRSGRGGGQSTPVDPSSGRRWPRPPPAGVSRSTLGPALIVITINCPMFTVGGSAASTASDRATRRSWCSHRGALVRLRTSLPKREKVQPSLPVLGLLKAATPAAAAAFLSDSCCSSRSSWTALALSASFTADIGSGFVVLFTVFSFFWSLAACAGLKSSWPVRRFKAEAVRSKATFHQKTVLRLRSLLITKR